ncbi:MAG: dihydroorotase [Chloroflexi bacterium]|nr:dihydroorotase [Chloroflexota bacterium]
MSARLLIKNARIIDPSDGSDAVGDLLIDGGVIAGRGPLSKSVLDATRVVDGTGMVVAPGFIDLHAHLREPGGEDKETIATGTAAGARGGFTTICCMPNTTPVIDSATVVQFIARQAADAGPVRVLPFGAVSRGRAGVELTDMEELARAGVAGFTDDGNPVATGHLMQMALLYAGQLGLPVMDHCEDHSITRRSGMNEGTHGLGVNEGWVASRLGLAGYPSAAEESIVARDIALLELAGGALHIAHLSTAGGIEQVRRAKERGLRVTAEATPHHLTMTEAWVLGSHGRGSPDEALSNDAYETRAKVSPPLRAETDRQALVEALADGTVDAIATDHAPHTFADKAVPFEEAAVGLSVLETALGSLMGLVHGGALDLAALVHRLTAGPAGVLGERYADLATLRKGTPADVVLFDPDESWVVDAASFASKGKNTPLDGETLVGRVKLTVAGGEIAYDGLAS